ncbi:MAG: hypothetical protein QGG61_06030 [Arenicellales bacterium]|nr:hypothetical protein [Arenicellales bacterium]
MTLPRSIYDRNPLCEETKRNWPENGHDLKPRFEAFAFSHCAAFIMESPNDPTPAQG